MHGIGRPVAGSLLRTRSALLAGLDDVSAQAPCFALLGFSDGALMAADLMLHRRVDAAVLLAGPLPVDAALLSPGVLSGTDVLWSYGDQDDVVPRALLEASQRWLVEQSGASVTVYVEPGLVHAVSQGQVSRTADFLAARLGRPTS